MPGRQDPLEALVDAISKVDAKVDELDVKVQKDLERRGSRIAGAVLAITLAILIPTASVLYGSGRVVAEVEGLREDLIELRGQQRANQERTDARLDRQRDQISGHAEALGELKGKLTRLRPDDETSRRRR